MAFRFSNYFLWFTFFMKCSRNIDIKWLILAGFNGICQIGLQ